MSNTCPFHYEVRFKLLAFDNENNVRNESFVKTFKDKPPLENRKNAFEEFNEYLSYIEATGRLRKNKQGNYYIIQPSFISEEIEQIEKIKESNIIFKAYDQFKEEISVLLIVTDPVIAKNVIDALEFSGEVKNEFEIHKVASYLDEEQFIIDNLEMNELPLYQYFNIDVGDLLEIVYHYGLDYSESGEDKEWGAKRIILKTPHKWQSLDEYNEHFQSTKTANEDSVEHNIDFSKIISKGESNHIEFKSSLLYNFKSGEGGIGVKYIVAKAICGFLNSNGGLLFIGINDNGIIQGLKYDYSLFSSGKEKDKLLLELDSLLAYFFDLSIKPLINSYVENVDGQDILIIEVYESHKPIFLRNKKSGHIEKEFYIRMNASTRQIADNEEIVEYVFNKKWKNLSS